MIMGVLDEYNLHLPESKETYNSARLSSRFFAFIIDILFVQFVFLFPLHRLFPENLSYADLFTYVEQLHPGMILFITALSSLIYLLYFSLCEYYLGRTLGMWFFGLRVSSLTYAKSVLRHIFVIFIFPLSLLWVVELVYLLLYKRRLMEQLTETQTYEVQKE